MGPSAVEPKVVVASKVYPKPLKSSGSLDRYKQIDVTPAIGTEFPSAKLVEWINASKADELLFDLAIKGGFRQARQKHQADCIKFQSVALSSFVPKMTSRTTSRSS